LGNGYHRDEEGLLRSDPILSGAVTTLAALIEPVRDRLATENYIVTQWNDGKTRCKNKQQALDLMRRAEKIERTGFDPDA
jgi:hypothetical protein